MSDQATIPAPPPAASKSSFRRIYPSTWLAILLAASVMFLVEFPGHRGFYRGTYSHGWPLVWMEGYDGSKPGRWLPPAPLADSAEPIVRTTLDQWEEARNPWALHDELRVFDIGSLAVDLGTAMLVLALLGFAFQFWRRRHGTLLRYRLRTLLAFIGIVALLIAPLASWHRELEREGAIIDGLKRECVAGLAYLETEGLYNNGDRIVSKVPVAGIDVRNGLDSAGMAARQPSENPNTSANVRSRRYVGNPRLPSN